MQYAVESRIVFVLQWAIHTHNKHTHTHTKAHTHNFDLIQPYLSLSLPLSLFLSLSLSIYLSLLYISLFSPGLTLSALAVSDNGNFVATGSMSEVIISSCHVVVIVVGGVFVVNVVVFLLWPRS